MDAKEINETIRETLILREIRIRRNENERRSAAMKKTLLEIKNARDRWELQLISTQDVNEKARLWGDYIATELTRGDLLFASKLCDRGLKEVPVQHCLRLYSIFIHFSNGDMTEARTILRKWLSRTSPSVAIWCNIHIPCEIKIAVIGAVRSAFESHTTLCQNEEAFMQFAEFERYVADDLERVKNVYDHGLSTLHGRKNTSTLLQECLSFHMVAGRVTEAEEIRTKYAEATQNSFGNWSGT